MFQEIGRRLADGLTGLLAYRDIQEREQKFRTLAENNLPNNIARYDQQARLIYANPRLQQTLGRSEKELLDKSSMERNPGEQFNDYEAKIKEVIRTGKRDEMELILPDWNGGLRYYHISFVAERSPDGEIIGRLGGEEFAVLLPETTTDEAWEAPERLQLAVARTEMKTEAGATLRVTVSIGITSLADDPASVETLLKQADEALYVAKDSGRNQIRMACGTPQR